MATTVATRSLVLTRANVRERDRTYQLLSPDLGLVDALARGTRRTGSKLAPHLEPIVESELLLVRGRRGELVAEATVSEPFLALRTDLNRRFASLAVGELVGALVRGAEGSSVYDLTRTALGQLSTAPIGSLDLVVIAFGFKLLQHLGWSLELGRCVRCHRPLTRTVNFASVRLGGLLCPTDRHADRSALALRPAAVATLRFVSGGELLRSVQLRVSGEDRRELARLLERAVTDVAERPLFGIRALVERTKRT